MHRDAGVVLFQDICTVAERTHPVSKRSYGLADTAGRATAKAETPAHAGVFF
jgi:hypothetical protein